MQILYKKKFLYDACIQSTLSACNNIHARKSTSWRGQCETRCHSFPSDCHTCQMNCLKTTFMHAHASTRMCDTNNNHFATAKAAALPRFAADLRQLMTSFPVNMHGLLGLPQCIQLLTSVVLEKIEICHLRNAQTTVDKEQKCQMTYRTDNEALEILFPNLKKIFGKSVESLQRNCDPNIIKNYVIQYLPEAAGDVISDRNVKTIQGYVVNFEVTSFSSFQDSNIATGDTYAFSVLPKKYEDHQMVMSPIYDQLQYVISSKLNVFLHKSLDNVFKYQIVLLRSRIHVLVYFSCQLCVKI